MVESEEREEKKHLGFLNGEGISKEGQSKKAKEASKLAMKESILIMIIISSKEQNQNHNNNNNNNNKVSLTYCLFCDVVVQNSNGVFNK